MKATGCWRAKSWALFRIASTSLSFSVEDSFLAPSATTRTYPALAVLLRSSSDATFSIAYDLARRPDGTREEGHSGAGAAQFEDERVEATRDEEDTTDNPNPSPMNPAFP